MKCCFDFVYKVNGTRKRTDNPVNDDFSVSVGESEKLVKVTLKPRAAVEFEKFAVVMPYEFGKDERIFTNGYQSWTVTKEYAPDGKMDEFRPRFLGFPKSKYKFLGLYAAGDLYWHDYPEQNGVFYGYSYGYVRKDRDIRLIGSLSEKSGYTLITYNTNNCTVTMEKDLEGVLFDSEKVVLEIATLNGDYDAVFDEYFAMMNIAKPRVKRSCGYTTWYNYYEAVTEEIVVRDLAAMSKIDTKIDIFQIDDGYQRTVGDWLEIKEDKFPRGMKYIVDKIHSTGMLAGLWLAPFGVTPKSHIYKQHKDWLARDKKGKCRYAGANWGGFYPLDIYNAEARAYIKKVFDVVLNEWGFDMVKLDFLYACCMYPMHNKSRGEIMCDAMDLIRECCGDKIVLGCGAPLAPSFGKVDFMRIGADIGLKWSNKPMHREDVSTQHALQNTIFRRHLDGRAWLNDPDVFILRDNNVKMALKEREIVADINSLCGNLLFVSDFVADYTEEQKKIFVETVTRSKAEIVMARFVTDSVISIDYTVDGKNGNLTFDLKRGIRL